MPKLLVTDKLRSYASAFRRDRRLVLCARSARSAGCAEVSSRRICYRADEPATGMLCVPAQRGLCWAGEPPDARYSFRSPAWQSLPVAGLANPLPCRCRPSSAPAFSIKMLGKPLQSRRISLTSAFRVVTYADDLVILCRRGSAEKAMHHLHEIMGKLKLTVNEEKTRICRVPDGEFDFLGYTFGGCTLQRLARPGWAIDRQRRASSAWSKGSTR